MKPQQKLIYQIFSRTLLERFDNIIEEWEEFQGIHGFENDFFKYVDGKISDLRKDIDWLRKVSPQHKTKLED